MITKADEAQLRAQGVPQAKIDKMTPEDARLNLKFPDTATRQVARVSGERIADAVKDDPQMVKDFHHNNLTNSDIRQALINSGESMVKPNGSPMQVLDRKLEGNTGDIGREPAINKLLDKGHSPADIKRLSKQTQ
jgi:hypothetical protein